MRNRRADRQTVVLHKGRSKKPGPGYPPPPPLLSQRTDGSRRKRAKEQQQRRRGSPMALLNRCIVYLLKNKSDVGLACPGYLFDLLQPYSVLFSIPPTGPQLMAPL